MKHVALLLCLSSLAIAASGQWGYDFRLPANKWRPCGTPQGAVDALGNTLFPEANLVDTHLVSFNKARLAWYSIDPLFLRDNSATPDHLTNEDQSNHYVREIEEPEITGAPGPNPGLNTTIFTLDLAFYPDERGSYNYEVAPTVYSEGIDPLTGNLHDPETRWGGVMRTLDVTDFENAGIQFLTFWLLDPFLYDSNSTGGDLYISLGNISEDVQKDSRKFFESGLQPPGSLVPMDTTAWGIVSVTQPITNTFDPDPDVREWQDFGLDGMDDDSERAYFSAYLAALQTYGADQNVIAHATADPSSDDYHFFLGDDYDSEQRSILERYKRYNNQQGNSPVSNGGNPISEAYSNIPDSEDLNWDFTVNESEEYYQYRINLHPNMQIGQNFITDKRVVSVTLQNGNNSLVTWYHFTIPLTQYDAQIGSIPDFKSIRFMRMFLTSFEDDVVLRFGKLQFEAATAVESPQQQMFSLYPNPASGELFIKGDEEIKSLSVFDLVGRRITPANLELSADARSARIELTAEGFYLIRVESAKGAKTYKVLNQ